MALETMIVEIVDREGVIAGLLIVMILMQFYQHRECMRKICSINQTILGMLEHELEDNHVN